MSGLLGSNLLGTDSSSAENLLWEDLAGIPKTGPAIVVAKHPFGMLEGAIRGTMLPRIRRDVKIMTNYLLAGLPEIEDSASLSICSTWGFGCHQSAPTVAGAPLA